MKSPPKRDPETPLDETPSVSGSRESDALSVGERLRIFSLVALTLVFVVLCAILAWPFLPALTWGVALAIIFGPMHRRIAGVLSPPWLAAGISATIVTAIILAAGAFAVYQLGKEASNAAERARQSQGESGGGVRATVAKLPGGTGVLEWTDRYNFDLEGQARRLVDHYTQDIASLAQGSMGAAIQFLMAIFILFFMFRDRGVLTAGVQRLLPLTFAESRDVFATAASSVYANLYATVISSFAQAASVGLAMWWLELPAPMLWTLVMFVFGILPILGAIVVWAPASAYLILVGRAGAGLLLIVIGTLAVSLTALVYVRIAGPRMRMHDVPLLLSFLGGLAVFGVSGMVLGPAILAVALALLKIWHHRLTGDEAAIVPGAPSSTSPESTLPMDAD